MKRTVIAAAGLLVLGACITHVPVPAVQQVPEVLKPAANETLVSAVYARGVQVYECRVKKDDSTAMEWAFIAPEAQLFDAQGKLVGKHFAGPSWQALDGSTIAGSVKARAEAPHTGTIPWLLLTTKSVASAGAFSKVTSVQRINTEGGAAPAAQDCTADWTGRRASIAYTADYVMYGNN